LVIIRHPQSQNFGTIPQADKQHFSDIREKLKSLLAQAQIGTRSATEWNSHVSSLNPSGRTAKDYWCAIYPPGADNKSYAPQVALIVSTRGVEICFCFGAAEGAFTDAEARRRNEQYLRDVRQRLRHLPGTLEAHPKRQVEDFVGRSQLGKRLKGYPPDHLIRIRRVRPN
jgi:hypothetical protein